MLLSEQWKKKVQSYELQFQMKRLMIEARKLEYNLNALKGEHEEDLKAAHNLSFELSNSPFQVNIFEDVVLESSPIFDSYEMKESHGPCSSHVNISCHDLFYDAPINHGDYEPNDPPIYDSYEMEDEDLNSLNVFSNELSVEGEEWTAVVNKGQGMTSLGMLIKQNLIACTLVDSEPESWRKGLKSDLLGYHSDVPKTVKAGGSAYLVEEAKSGAEHEISGLRTPELNLTSLVTAPKEPSHAHSLLSLTNHDQSVLFVSLGTPNSIPSSTRSLEQ